MTNKPRLEYFDVLKGLAIFLVVMGHVLTISIRGIDSAFSFKLIGEIHMPVFFFISGFFTYKIIDTKDFATPNLKQRFLQLIVPFVVVSALWVWFYTHSRLESPFDAHISSLYADTSKHGYWFTLCLFEIILIYAGLSYIFRLITNQIIQILITISIWILLGALALYILPERIGNILSLINVCQFFPIFMVGVFAKKNQNCYNRAIGNSWIYTASLIVFCPVLYYTCYYWEFPSIPAGFVYITRCILHITFVCVAITAVKAWLDKTTPQNKAVRIFSYLGKESLAIYLLHYFLLFPMSFMQEPLREMGLGLVPTFVVAAAVASIIIALVLIINHIIGRSKLLSLLLTGKVKGISINSTNKLNNR